LQVLSLPQQQHEKLINLDLFGHSLKSFVMQISIQSLEVTYDRVPYRFLVKRVLDTRNREITFHCWAPEDSVRAKELIRGDVLMFKWDDEYGDLKPFSEYPVTDTLKQAIRENFFMERA
jgi:hypothetical protein